MQSKRVEQPIKSKIVTTVDVVMTEAIVLPVAKFATGVAIKITLLKNVSKLIKIQVHATGPEVRVTVTSANLVANLRKSLTQLRLTLMIVMVVMQSPRWRI